MEPDDLLCSRNARPQKALVGRAQWKINQPLSLKRQRASEEGSSIHVFNQGLADVRSSVDGLDPFHGGSVMLVRIRCRDKLPDRK